MSTFRCSLIGQQNWMGLLTIILLFAGFQVLPGQENPMFRKSQTRAVIVGISDYQNISDLDYAHRDAEALAAYLQSDAGGKVPPENIRLLLNKDATQMQFAMALDWLQEESQAGDRAYIYFSGHGDVEKKTAMQRGFLLNYDAPSTTYMAGGAFPILFLQDIVSTLSVDKGVEVILMADACRAGKLAGDAIGGNHVTAERLSESFANEIKILSCQQDELSQEGSQWGDGRGVFSFHLIEGLIGLADDSGNGDQKVNLRELRNYLEEQVGQETGGKQIPVVVGDLSHALVDVDQQSLALLLEKKRLESDQEIVALKTRGPVQTDPDSLVWRKYEAFQQALRDKRFLYAENEKEPAYSIYLDLKDEPVMGPYHAEMKRDLAIGLHDEVQQAINNYLQSSPEELYRRWSYDQRYEHYPEYLGISADLLGDQHFMHEDLITRRKYFEGLQLRLRGERDKSNENLFNEALQKQQEVVRRDSTAAYAYNEIGLLYRRLKQTSESIPYFESANEYSPAWVLPLINLSTNYLELGRIEQALEKVEGALKQDSTFALAHYNQGLIYTQLDKPEKAKQSYQKAVIYDPNYANAYYNLGHLYFQEGNLEQTEAMFLRYSETMLEEEAAVWSDLGYIASLRDHPEDALRYFEKGLATDPEFPLTYLNMGEFLLEIGRLEEAEKALESYQEKKPDEVDGYYLLAAAKARAGRTKAAIKQLEKALEKGFNNREQLQKDAHFESIRSKKAFRQLLEEMQDQ